MLRRLTSIALLALAAPAFGKTLKVPQQFPTVEDALDVVQKGDVIRLAAGHHVVRAHLSNLEGVSIRGAGPKNTFVVESENLSAMPPTVFDVFKCTDISISGLTIEGGSSFAIYLTNSRKIAVRDVRIRGTGVGSAPGPIEASNCEDLEFTRVAFLDMQTTPLRLGFASFEIGGQVKISRCTFQDLTGFAIDLHANGIVLDRNRFKRIHGGAAVSVSAGDVVGEARITRNVFDDVDGAAIVVDGNHFARLTGNRVRGAGIYGFDLLTGLGAEVRSNRLSDLQVGIECALQNAILERNRIEGATNNALSVHGADALVARNVIVDAVGDGIVVAGADIALRANRITAPGVHGVFVSAGSPGCVLAGNRVVRPKADGFKVAQDATVLNGNAVSKASEHGFEIISTGNTLKHNSARGSTLSDLLCDLQTNTIAKNNDFGTVEDLP